MYPRILALNKPKIISLTQFAILLGISVVAPLFHFQPITGPIVNACLFIATAILDVQAGIMLGLLPSLIALSAGTLPAPLAPMIPFIMVSNTIMVVAFSAIFARKGTKLLFEKELGSFHSPSFSLAVISASILKFLFLFPTSYIVIHLISQKPIAQKAATMMSWPQLATALLGGLIAFIFLKLTFGSEKVK
ncbi:MAG: ECF transporter S component [Candidatus Pacebacteria bacterium]|nr:ECF transporter S component [Candidatus Paceibacterota bacterium]